MFKIPDNIKMKHVHGHPPYEQMSILKDICNKSTPYSETRKVSIGMTKKKNKNQQKWLTDKLKGDWMDKELIIEIALFESLIHYVEKEDGLNDAAYDYSYELEKGHIDQKTANANKKRQKELKNAYLYLKNERPALQYQVDNWGGTNVNEYLILEESFLKKDTKIMNTIIKYRGYLWN